MYEVHFSCSNCGHSETRQVSRGQTISEYCKYSQCNNCGCPTLRENKLPEPKSRWRPEEFYLKDDNDNKYLCKVVEDSVVQIG